MTITWFQRDLPFHQITYPTSDDLYQRTTRCDVLGNDDSSILRSRFLQAAYRTASCIVVLGRIAGREVYVCLGYRAIDVYLSIVGNMMVVGTRLRSRISTRKVSLRWTRTATPRFAGNMTKVEN